MLRRWAIKWNNGSEDISDEIEALYSNLKSLVDANASPLEIGDYIAMAGLNIWYPLRHRLQHLNALEAIQYFENCIDTSTLNHCGSLSREPLASPISCRLVAD